MILRRLVLPATLLFTSFSVIPAIAQQAAIAADPTADKAHPATMDAFQLPSHGAQLNALVYTAAGAGPHPVVLLLHGFPGNERNLDIAQALRRAGYDVLFFDYRGSWGSPGEFSFTHAIEDTEAAIAYLRVPANATRLRADPQNLIVVGHSMGGMITAIVTAHDPAIRAAIMISAANMAGRIPANLPAAQQQTAIKAVSTGLAAQGMAPLAGCTPESLARELVDNTAAWNFLNLAPKLASRPILVISSDDGNTPSADALVANLKTAGATEVSAVHIATDHSYSDHRIALQAAILTALDRLPSKY